jgi:hypothetical protein
VPYPRASGWMLMRAVVEIGDKEMRNLCPAWPATSTMNALQTQINSHFFPPCLHAL